MSRAQGHVAPEDACIECGEYGSVRCGCCGFPLCGMHHELGGGFCPRFTPIGGVPVCPYPNEVYVRPLPRPQGQEPIVLEAATATAYHLPSHHGEDGTLCGVDNDGLDERPLEDVLIDDHNLCLMCERAARYERRARKRMVHRDLEVDDE